MGATLKRIDSPEDFRDVLHLEHALVLICFRERELSSQSRQAIEKLNGQWPVYQLFPDDHPDTWKWANDLIEPSEEEQTSEAMVWLEKGSALDCLIGVDKTSSEVISRLTHDCFINGKVHSLNAPREMAPFNVELLKILCCPETHQALSPATPAILQKLNQQIESGRLQNRSRNPVKEKISNGLVRADGAVIYPMRHNIPILLVDEAIPLG
jgi:uncharacterized protein